MLRNLKDLENYRISATDGAIGHLKDFYFEDDVWVVRYFVVEAGTWLSSKRVLISPIAVRSPDWLMRTLPVSITKDQVRHSPDIDTDKPVSRQNESRYLGYYAYPNYWGGGGIWADALYPYAMVPGYVDDETGRRARERDIEAYLRDRRARHRDDDPHLRSCNEVTGYRIHAADGDIGHVSGFLVDDETWVILYLIVDTSNWWTGHEVLVAPSFITRVHWADRTVAIELSRESIRNAPPYDSSAEGGRDQAMSLYRHFGRSGYWAGRSASSAER